MRLLLDMLWVAVEVAWRMVEVVLNILCVVLLFDIFFDGVFGD